MKKLVLTFVLGFVMTANLQAQLLRNLVLTSGNNESFVLYVNQNQINHQALGEVRVTGLVENFYDITIYTDRTNRVLRANLYVPPLSEVVYTFFPPSLQNAQGEFVISQLIPTQEGVVGQSGSFVFGETGLPTGANTGQINININNTVDTNIVTVEETEVIPDVVVQEVVYVDGYTGEIGCQPPLSQSRFNSMLNTIDDQSFASSKKRIAKQIISNNCMVVGDLVQILELFTFESDKLEMAKFAYQYIYDIENYYEVNNVFDFETSIEELDRFLQGR